MLRLTVSELYGVASVKLNWLGGINFIECICSSQIHLQANHSEFDCPYSVRDDIKEGKTFVFWNLDAEFQNTAIVGLGKPSKGFSQEERICEDKESVRSAASGNLPIVP